MAVRIDELAALANTSTATVSRVLNNKPGVAEPTRKRVIALADKLGYRPNRIAQNLALQKSHVLAMVAADLFNQFYVEFLHRVQKRVEAMGYQVLTADSEQSVEKEKYNIGIMRQHRAEGLILFPVADWKMQAGCDHLLEMRLRKYPFVVVGKLGEFVCDSVTNEEPETAYALARHLLEFGHRRISFVGFDDDNRPVRERFDGARRALREAGVDFDPDHVVQHRDTESWVHDMVAMLRSANRPTAIIFMNDVLALEAQRPLAELGIRVPEELSTVNFGNQIWTSHLKPSLTSTMEDGAQLAQQAMDLLLGRMQDPERPYRQLAVPQRVIFRESSGPCPRNI